MEPLTAVVVGHADLGENDRIVRFLTAERGRLDLVARGARASRKRYGGLLELGTRVRVIPARGRGALVRIDSIELVKAPDRARSDLDRIALLAYGCEVVARLAGEDMPEPRLTRLLVVFLELLELDPVAGPASRIALEAKALTFAGVLPSLTHCAGCREPLEDPVVFGWESGAAHAACGAGVPTTTAHLAALEVLRRTPLFETLELPSPGGWLLSDLVQHHTRRELKSRGLLASLV
ncbi:MAG: DNA repair protein RecO [Alphaproteobacteria bacterium]|nr:DNA repair protein RecO [Alphaproteobacteria bacterium]MCB9690606.1 DNA repair protein RecO [Alphaproteobacteria bacterium]